MLTRQSVLATLSIRERLRAGVSCIWTPPSAGRRYGQKPRSYNTSVYNSMYCMYRAAYCLDETPNSAFASGVGANALPSTTGINSQNTPYRGARLEKRPRATQPNDCAFLHPSLPSVPSLSPSLSLLPSAVCSIPARSSNVFFLGVPSTAFAASATISLSFFLCPPPSLTTPSLCLSRRPPAYFLPYPITGSATHTVNRELLTLYHLWPFPAPSARPPSSAPRRRASLR